MNPFHTIAIPHKDILEGRLTLDIYAADLWQVYKQHAPSDYKDGEEFFRKTFITKGLSNLINIVHKRLSGKGGDPVIQLQTPFGGGKTHSLIALYHKAKEWNAKTIVMVGTPLDGNIKLWEMFEHQLTGKIDKLKSLTSPGRDKLIEVLTSHQPLLILMDEVLEYVTKAAGIKVEDSTLASQTLAFMQELTEAVALLENTALVVTLPSSIIEHYDEAAEKFFQQLQKICGRVERIYTPVEEDEITEVIRKRLFSAIDNNQASKIITNFIQYLEKENILPNGLEPSEYRELFKKSYPFLPEVIKVLYERWGSFPNFQRTRGVLRLLSLVIYSLKEKNIPYISLSDFNLSNPDIRAQLVPHIGSQFESVISSDITSEDSGSKKVDQKLGDSYKGLKIATRAATTIFMYSFSGGVLKGATKNEIKRAATTLNNSASVVGEALEELKNSLFYLQFVQERYFFTNQPNLNRIIITKMDNVSEKDIESEEKNALKKFINSSSDYFATYLWIENSSDIPDTKNFKLIILKNVDENFINELIDTKGKSPRIFKNNIFFLAPLETKKGELFNFIKRFIAYKRILNDKTLNLNTSQITEIKEKLNESEKDFKDILRSFYRLLYIPAQQGFKEEDIGTPVYGTAKKIDEEVYEYLLSKNEILKNMSPLVIENKYLTANDYVKISQIYDSSLNTKGEIRFTNINVLLNAIIDGVKQGIFGLGNQSGEEIECLYIKEQPENINENMFVLSKEFCSKYYKKPSGDEYEEEKGKGGIISQDNEPYNSENSSQPETTPNPPSPTPDKTNEITSLNLSFDIPKGKAREIGSMLNFLTLKFNNIEITIKAQNGSLSNQELENSIKETLFQLGINAKIEEN